MVSDNDDPFPNSYGVVAVNDLDEPFPIMSQLVRLQPELVLVERPDYSGTCLKWSLY